MPDIGPVSVDRAGAVAALFDAEHLDRRELENTLWSGRGDAVVLGDDGGCGAVAVLSYGRIGIVRFLAVAAGSRRRGVGSALLRAGTAWLVDRGATELWTGADAPFYLWPGVDAAWTPALSFFEAAGYERAGVELNMSFGVGAATASPPAGVSVERVRDGADVIPFVASRWPHWVAETERGIADGHCFAATDDEGVVGFICHSVCRQGWLGPMGTDPARQHGGVGSALVAAVATDLRAAGHNAVEIAWVGPVGFYAKAVGAVVSRTFVRMRSRISR